MRSPQGAGPGASIALSPFTCVSYSACSPRSRRSFPCAAMAAGRPRRRAPLLPRGLERLGAGTWGSAASTRAGPAPPHPLLGVGRGGPGLALPARGSCRGPTAPGLASLPAGCWATTRLPYAQGSVAKQPGPRVRAPKCPASWYPLAACPPPPECRLATTARQHPSQHGRWPSTTVGGNTTAAPDPGLPLVTCFPQIPKTSIRWGPPFGSHGPEP